MKHLRDIALALAAIICGSTTAANAEKWSCEMEMKKGKPYKQEWIVSDDKMKMFVPKGKGFYRVAVDDDDTLLGFLRFWADPAKSPRPFTSYVLIVKSTGVAIEIDDNDFDWDRDPSSGCRRGVSSFGHCSLEQP
jgi:hypothetical protein